MIAALNSDLMPVRLRPVDKLSDPNHMQKIPYKVLEALRVNEKWKGGYYEKVKEVFSSRLAKTECRAICSKNDGTAYRRDLCARLGIDPPDSMYDLGERLQRRRERSAAFRVTRDAKKKRRRAVGLTETRRVPGMRRWRPHLAVPQA
ncbi:hypothetical protein CYMTET_5238 [Cymbomonas tetramitiformis]|uniref:Uncharacterized protein n=1 Tax=Cymbomonas tetramitiformis TaxID=36881 RepID=A0AAE0LJ32_9CHLO|nr:hypothetical protein CYMTET_5238 [Cymbomonas tetramitiformis]